MTWLLTIMGPFINRTIQSAIRRVKDNPITSAGGGVLAILTTTVIYLEDHGCALTAIDYVGLFLATAAPGALATDNGKEVEAILAKPPVGADHERPEVQG